MRIYEIVMEVNGNEEHKHPVLWKSEADRCI